MQKVTPFLWFDGKAEEAMNFYTSIFKNSKIVSIKYWGEGSTFPKRHVMSGTFELDGQQFHVMDAGPKFKFTEAISLFVSCETQQEVDHFWGKLCEGGEEQRCGWLKDKFGVSWQIVPSVLGEMLQDKNPKKSKQVMEALLKMDKIDISLLKQAYEQG